MPTRSRGAVAAGHQLTADAAANVLRDGGNAFDAVLSAATAACVVEPALASLGGGGFLLAQPVGQQPRIYDFFVQTPSRCRPEHEMDFFPVQVDFGTATQEFHVGRAAAAVPGMVRGLFQIHRDLGSMPIADIFSAAIDYAGKGHTVSEFQAYVFRILTPIFMASDQAAAIFADRDDPTVPVTESQMLVQPELADLLEALAAEGEDLFYRGEVSDCIARQMTDGGHLTRTDIENYTVERRHPLTVEYRDTTLFTNAPPSSGGLLIAFALKLLERFEVGACQLGGAAHVDIMRQAMALTSAARIDAEAVKSETHPIADIMLDPDYLSRWRSKVMGHPRVTRGTTHISVIDDRGNLAALSVSNGEGSACIVPGTGIHLNNMLGEDDLHPAGFHRWSKDVRMTSMMAPTLCNLADGRQLALGSGGSNRLRSAILQVLVNVIDHDMGLELAVDAPRVHYEGDLLSVEGGFDAEAIASALDAVPRFQLWDEKNMFFGGTHSVMGGPKGVEVAGDARRSGVCVKLD